MARRRNLLIKGLVLVFAMWLLINYIFAASEQPAADKQIDDKAPVVVNVVKRERSLQQQPLQQQQQFQQQQPPLQQNAIIEQIESSNTKTKDPGKEPDVGNDIGNDAGGYLLPPREPNGPGEMGKPVKLTNLTAEQQKLVKLGWKNNAFNQYISDMISLHRTLPDPRDKE